MQELISSMKQEISFFESSIDPITRLSTDMNITLSGYVTAPSKTRDLPASDGTPKVSVNLHVLYAFLSRWTFAEICDLQVDCNWGGVLPGDTSIKFWPWGRTIPLWHRRWDSSASPWCFRGVTRFELPFPCVMPGCFLARHCCRQCQVSELKTLHVEECAPFICASFDIECVPEVSSSPNTPLHNTFEVKSCYLFWFRVHSN